MDIRIVSTSAARRVRNTLLLHGRVFSPPFEVKPIGNPTRLQAALDPDSGVRAFRDAGNLYGLGHPAQQQDDILAPAHIGSGTLDNPQAAA